MCSYKIFLCDIKIYTVVFHTLRSKLNGIEMNIFILYHCIFYFYDGWRSWVQQLENNLIAEKNTSMEK